MSTVPADLGDYSDAELISSVRDGVNAAYGTLYERHVTAAYNLARQLANSPAETDDLVSDAFAKVLDTLSAGKGPDSSFRAYLLTALRHTAYDKTRKDRKVDLTEDMSDAGGSVGAALTEQFTDTAMSGLERSLAAKAYARLPERWQAVLWHTEVEQQSAADVAPMLGLTANGVSALAYRAREGLRQAYLQVHLAETEAERCRATAERLGAWTRSGLSKRERSQVETHLDECDHCRGLAAELADVNGGLRGVVAPLVLGGAALAYLSAAGAGKAAAATVATAGAATAAGSGSGAGAAAGAAATGPREFAGVATSTVAMVAAAALAVAAGGGSQDIPEAKQQAAKPPNKEAPANPGQSDNSSGSSDSGSDNDSDDNDSDDNDSPDDSDNDSPDEPSPKSPEKPTPSDSDSPSKSESPDSPDVTVDQPDGDITLSPGGDPTELPITVRNDGDAKSDPVEATLDLPDGVEVVEPGGGGGAPMGGGGGAAPAAQSESETSTVDCPASTGDTATCGTDEGLRPDESVTLTFLLQATEDAEPSEVTGTVNSGDASPIDISVPVVAENIELDVEKKWQKPPEHDWHGIDWFWHWWQPPKLAITVTDTGETSGTVDLVTTQNGTTISEDDPSLDPGDEKTVRVKPDDPAGPVTVTATMGEVTEEKTVDVTPWHWWQHHLPGKPDEHESSTSSSPESETTKPGSETSEPGSSDSGGTSTDSTTKPHPSTTTTTPTDSGGPSTTPSSPEKSSSPSGPESSTSTGDSGTHEPHHHSHSTWRSHSRGHSGSGHHHSPADRREHPSR